MLHIVSILHTHTHTHTHTILLPCKENGYSYVELNASSTRSKRTLHDQVASLLSCLSIGPLVKGGVSSGRRHVLIMDEVDGMAGNEDRGGMQVCSLKFMPNIDFFLLIQLIA